MKSKRQWGVSAANYTHRIYTLGLLTEWQYRSLFIEMGKHGYRKGEPDGMPTETSQVFTKVFETLRAEGITKRQVADELAIYPDDLNRAIFGLALVPGNGNSDPDSGTPEKSTEPPQLRLL